MERTEAASSGCTCSNRTFMELKYIWTGYSLIRQTVLIAPLWNWNYQTRKPYPLHLRSNRTFMELKSLGRDANALSTQVLIAPLWNWNWLATDSFFKATCSNRTFMELKSRMNGFSVSSICCSNRTFMELKYIPKWLKPILPSVLIAPLWNWNHKHGILLYLS